MWEVLTCGNVRLRASITSIAKILGVSPGTLYNHIPDLRELRTSRTQAIEDSTG